MWELHLFSPTWWVPTSHTASWTTACRHRWNKAWEGRKFPFSSRDPAVERNFQIQKRQRGFSPKSLSSVWSKAGLDKTVVQNCICNQPEMSAVTVVDGEDWSKINYFDTFNTVKSQKLRNAAKKRRFCIFTTFFLKTPLSYMQSCIPKQRALQTAALIFSGNLIISCICFVDEKVN